MDGINQLDLITQRVLSLQVKNLTEELGQAQAELDQAKKRIAELEAPPAEPKAE
jgi:cell division protein FtsB